MNLLHILLLATATPASTPDQVEKPDVSVKVEISEFDQAPADEPQSDAMVDATTDYYDRLTVPVTIEGEGPFQFMIDTGAQATVVTRRLTDRLELEPAGYATIVGMGGRKTVQLVELNGLEFAERILDNISAPLLETRNVGADGILGLDSLQDMRVLIDFRDETIAVNDSEELGGNRGYEIVVRARRKLGRLIITEAQVDGIRTAVVIDTGAEGSFGNGKLEQRIRKRVQGTARSTDVLGTKIIGELHLVKRLSIGRLNLDNMSITFADSPAFEALGLGNRPALILGMRDLRMFDRVAIDFSSRKVLFDLPRGSHRSQPVLHFGPSAP